MSKDWIPHFFAYCPKKTFPNWICELNPRCPDPVARPNVFLVKKNWSFLNGNMPKKCTKYNGSARLLMWDKICGMSNCFFKPCFCFATVFSAMRTCSRFSTRFVVANLFWFRLMTCNNKFSTWFVVANSFWTQFMSNSRQKQQDVCSRFRFNEHSVTTNSVIDQVQPVLLPTFQKFGMNWFEFWIGLDPNGVSEGLGWSIRCLNWQLTGTVKLHGYMVI